MQIEQLCMHYKILPVFVLEKPCARTQNTSHKFTKNGKYEIPALDDLRFRFLFGVSTISTVTATFSKNSTTR